MKSVHCSATSTIVVASNTRQGLASLGQRSEACTTQWYLWPLVLDDNKRQTAACLVAWRLTCCHAHVQLMLATTRAFAAHSEEYPVRSCSRAHVTHTHHHEHHTLVRAQHTCPVCHGHTHTHTRQGIAKKVLIGAEIDETKNKASRTPRTCARTPPRHSPLQCHLLVARFVIDIDATTASGDSAWWCRLTAGAEVLLLSCSAL
jgi:hypothetical protein